MRQEAGSPCAPAATGGRQTGSSDRGFGLVFGVVFAVVALWPVLDGGAPAWWAAALSGAFFALALWRPAVLRPLNRVWTRFGLLLHRVTNPVIMLFLFVTTIVPLGLALRALGKDPLRLKRAPGAKTYWIERRPPGPDPSTMSNQF